FLMRAIPGDPALYMLGDFATADALATLRARLGLDLPVWQQYGVFLLRARRVASASAVAKSPSMYSAGSPGMARIRKNATVTIPTSATANCAAQRAR
ncbi:MAG: hypothetical protein ACKOC9_06340, partial [Alphaproteobacteria bacterium]